MKKKWMTLFVEPVTPALISGAQPRRIDEHMPIRPSSVRGLLRSWFRAAAAPRIDWSTESWRGGERSLGKVLGSYR